jgi:hypothetical protein
MSLTIPKGKTRVILDVSPQRRRIYVQLVPSDNTRPVVPFVRLHKRSDKHAKGELWVGYV